MDLTGTLLPSVAVAALPEDLAPALAAEDTPSSRSFLTTLRVYFMLTKPRVIDQQAKLTYDLPGGAPRLSCRSEGIELVCVNGSPMLEHGELTGNRTGRVLRGG